jgi:hypothetical protein
MKRILSVVLTGEKLARGRMLGVSTAEQNKYCDDDRNTL